MTDDPNNEVTQESNVVHGSMSGRDTNITYNLGRDSIGKSSYLETLYAKLKAEKENNVTISETIERLKHYKSRASEGDILSVEEKLSLGNRDKYAEFAIAAKEMFSKKLLRNENSETAQEIFSFLLAKIWAAFKSDIEPAIGNGHSEEYINELVKQKIIEPIAEILGQNVLRIYDDEIYGMTYFLTGNCHIKWH